MTHLSQKNAFCLIVGLSRFFCLLQGLLVMLTCSYVLNKNATKLMIAVSDVVDIYLHRKIFRFFSGKLRL